MQPKSGFWTSEFFTTLSTLGVTMIGILVTLGVIPVGDSERVTQTVTGMIATLGGFIANAVALWKYIQSRSEIKRAAINALANIEMQKEQVRGEITKAEFKKEEHVASLNLERERMTTTATA